MELNFVKMHGLGNDFIFIDDPSEQIDLDDDQIRRLCDRHFGIGADGVILVRPSHDAHAVAYMHYINADGSLAQMCGNGVRCFAKYLIDRGFADLPSGRLVVETMAGIYVIQFALDDAQKMTFATVDMGCPILDPEEVPVSAVANASTPTGIPFAREVGISSPWGEFSFTCVSMGNPHAVCFIDDWDALPDELFTDAAPKGLETFRVDAIGAWYESNPAFPEKTNVEFACMTDTGIAMRVFERGCGETLACGTGACATLVSAVLTKRVTDRASVDLLGGSLDIAWDGEGSVFMTGSAVEAFTGTIEV